jgi:4-aminobutyrate aminotransferase/(S)-3-amino-2-methylpropionate transaminase
MKSIISLKTPIPGPKSQALLARRKAAVPQGPFNIATIFVEPCEGGVYEAARFASGI